VNVTVIARIDADGRLQLPQEMRQRFAPDQEVELVPCRDGVLLKPRRPASLAEVLKRKVSMHQPTHLDLSEIDMDVLGG